MGENKTLRTDTGFFWTVKIIIGQCVLYIKQKMPDVDKGCSSVFKRKGDTYEKDYTKN